MKNLLLKFVGPLLAIAGVMGLTGSSILWNFQGRALGLPATVISLLILSIGIIFLRPLEPAVVVDEMNHNEASVVSIEAPRASSENISSNQVSNIGNIQVDDGETKTAVIEANSLQKPLLTTAEKIAVELAAEEAGKPVVILTNFAPGALLPGNSIRTNKRAPGQNMSRFRNMASDLFKTS